MAQDEIPKIGRDFQQWSDLDSQLRPIDLDIELYIRQNVWIASYVILAGLLKGNKQLREKYIRILTSEYFDKKSLLKYLFEKIVNYLEKNDSIPISELEKWIPEYAIEVWDEKPPDERMLYANQLALRQIISFIPTEEQMNRAIELRKEKMEKHGFETDQQR